VRVDKRILAALNAKHAFTDSLANTENIGKASQELTTVWNEKHPDDQIVIA
jgi:hypothetical protein